MATRNVNSLNSKLAVPRSKFTVYAFLYVRKRLIGPPASAMLMFVSLIVPSASMLFFAKFSNIIERLGPLLSIILTPDFNKFV